MRSWCNQPRASVDQEIELSGLVELNSVPACGHVAQRERASAFEAEGCRVEPCRGRQQKKPRLASMPLAHVRNLKTFARLRARAPAASARHRAAHEALSEAQASARSDATKLGRTEGIDPAEALGSPWTAEKAARSTDAPRSQTTGHRWRNRQPCEGP